MKRKTVLITGAKGQLGNEIFKESFNVGIFDFIFTDIEELDITDNKAVNKAISQHSPFAVINCAAYTNVDKAELEPEAAYLINSTGVTNLAATCAINNVLLIHISTDYVFDGTAIKPYREDAPLNPQSVYAKSKTYGEKSILSSGTSYIIIRTSWLYSVFGNNFVKTILSKAKETKELKVVNDQIGSPTSAKDLSKTVLQILQHPLLRTEQLKEIFHYSNAGTVSWFDFACEIVKYAKLKCNILPISASEYNFSAPRPKYSVLDTSKIKKFLNIKIPTWKDSLHVCLNEICERH